jgi:hypothetical protein
MKQHSSRSGRAAAARDGEAHADGVWVSAGANVFGGRSQTSLFGQLDKNDNVYVTVRYEF